MNASSRATPTGRLYDDLRAPLLLGPRPRTLANEPGASYVDHVDRMRTLSVPLVAFVDLRDDETQDDAAKRVDELIAFLLSRQNRDMLRMWLSRPSRTSTSTSSDAY